MDINFRPLETDDLAKIHVWFQVPEVKKWYARDDDWALDKVKEKYLPRLQGAVNVPSFIINLNTEEIGFIQYYPLTEGLPETLTAELAKEYKIDLENSAGIDLFIAREDMLGKGIGVTIINDFLKDIVPKNFHIIFVDPEVKNLRAIRAYEKCGFVKLKITDSNKYFLMNLERS